MYQQTVGAATAQDRHVNTLQQRGMRSKFYTPGRTSYQEESAVRFGWWAIDRYEQWLGPHASASHDATRVGQSAKRVRASV